MITLRQRNLELSHSLQATPGARQVKARDSDGSDAKQFDRRFAIAA